MIDKIRGALEEISIRGFKSLKNVETLKLPPLAVLIGANGSGKSNFIHFFEMIGWMLRSRRLQDFILTNGGADDVLFQGNRVTPRMSAELRIKTAAGFNDYKFSLTHVAGDRLMFSEEAYRYSNTKDFKTLRSWSSLPVPYMESGIPAASQSSKTAKVVMNLLQNCTVYQFHDTSARANIKSLWDISDNSWLRSDGANLAPVLYRLLEKDLLRYKLICRQIERVLPSFRDFQLQPVNEKIHLRWSGKYSEKTFGANLTSDGSLRLFCLFTLLNLPTEVLPDILFLDEPELGLHPHAITLLGAMIKRVATSRQVIVATQSPLLVDCFELDNIIVADNVEGATEFKSMDRARYSDWLESEFLPSEIWLKDAVGFRV